MSLILLLFQESWWTGINAVYSIMGIVIIAAISVLILLSKGRKETDAINEKRATASDALVKLRDTELDDVRKRLGQVEEELEDITTEYRTLTGIKLDELFKFWQHKLDREAHWQNIEDTNLMLKKRLIDKTDA